MGGNQPGFVGRTAVGPANCHGEGVQPVGHDPYFAHPVLPVGHPFLPFRAQGSASVGRSQPLQAAGNNPMARMTNPEKEWYLGRMRGLFRLACLVLLCVSGTALAQTIPPPQRPFSQLIEVWTRQLDRIAYRTSQPDILPAEIDALREQAADVRTAAAAAAALAR